MAKAKRKPKAKAKVTRRKPIVPSPAQATRKIPPAAIATQFKPGQSGNPGGKPVGARNRLQGDFVAKLAEDFEKHGATAIAACRIKKPADYLRVVASLMPKEVDVRNASDDLTDEDLARIAVALRSYIGTGEGGTDAIPSPESSTAH